MKSKEFDDQLRQRFEDASLPYNPGNWQKLSATLDERKAKGRTMFLLPIASIAASVALAIGIVTWINRVDTDGPAQAQSHVPAPRTHVADNHVQNAPLSETAVEMPVLVNTTTLPIAKQQRQQQPSANAPYITVQEQEPAPAIIASVEQPNTFNADPGIVTPKENMPKATTLNNNVFYDNVRPVKNEKKNFVTMMGGINYGTLNSGYVMGFAAGTKLNNKFYFESDVAFVGNISSNTNVSFITQRNATAKNARSTDVSYTTKTVEQKKFYNIYYAQVTPTLGYKVASKLSVGVGADVQRLLITDKLVSEADNKELPGFDVGVVGKTEYSLSREIKASVYYRKGMNQSISGNSKLLDRDYLQVQLKFTIFNK